MPNSVFDNNRIFTNSDPNNSQIRWRLLKEKLAELGYDLVTADDRDLHDCAGIIFHDSVSLKDFPNKNFNLRQFLKGILGWGKKNTEGVRDLYKEGVAGGLKEKMLLLLWEGPAVYPLNFSEKVWERFSYILTWADDFLQDQRVRHYVMPMEMNGLIKTPVPFNEKKLLLNISIHKHSSYSTELYSAREKSVAFFDKHYPTLFDLYGTRWNTPVTRLQRFFPFLVKKYNTYRGRTENKLETLSRYKFNLCYENNSNVNGYISEKIFTAIQARTVPIYLGAPNIQDYVDPDTFIDRRNFKTEKELADFLISMTEYEYQKYLDAGHRYSHSEKYIKFLPSSFCDTIIDILKKSSIID